FSRREPLGVVLVLAPWNYPWLTSVNAVVPALLAGNTVVLKMAQQTPLVAERYRQAFAAAGLPDGVFQFLHIDHESAARVIADPRIGFIAFTGSVGGGHAVQRAAAGRFIATGLELGGKDPAYVRADAPLRATIENLVDGAYFNSGQSCCAVERIYVHRAVFKPFVEGFVDVDHGMAVMTEETFGPVVGIMAVASDEEAIGLMNDSRYGLTASIWSADAQAAIRIGDRVETGTWFMNRCDYLDPALAWTG